MKNVVSVFLMLFLLSFKLTAQTGLMDFDATSYDFGDVKEAGKVGHEFKFVNKGKAPVIISDVKASCGCTTPTWPKEPIMPGQTAVIKAEFDTENRPGIFNKTITVTANTEPSNTVLTINGNVIPKAKSTEEEMPKKVGAIRITSETLDMGKVSTEKPSSKEFPIYNDGANPVTFTVPATLPKSLLVTVVPTTLAPKQRGNIKITYDAKKKNDVGPVTDKFQLTTNEAEANKKSFTVTADIKEYFPPLSAEQLAAAPKAALSTNEQNFGPVKVGSVNTADITIINNGKQDLLIRKLRANPSVTTAQPDKTVIKAGQQATVKITYKPTKKGIDSGTISVYTNDPASPLQYITTKANVSE